MIGKFLIILLFIFLYCVISGGLCYTVIGIHNPIHKFLIEEDSYDGSKNVKIESVDDKFFFFILFFIWPLLVLFYWIPIGLFKIFKFLVEFIAWCIAKLFKL